MIARLAALVLFVWPGLLVAADYRLRSGEHADFSRVVVEMNVIPGWTLGKVQGGYELRLDDFDAAFALGNVFQKIPRDRIKDVEAVGAGRLFLKVDCACHADAFEIASGLVIDMKDGPATPSSQFESRLDDVESGLTPDAASARFRPLPGSASDWPATPLEGSPDLTKYYRAGRTEYLWDSELALGLDEPHRSNISSTSQRSITHARPRAIQEEIEPGAADPSERVETARADLVENLARAALQGLVQADLSETEDRVAKTAPAPDAESKTANPHGDGPPSDSLPRIMEANSSHMQIETAVDRAFGVTAEPPAITADGYGCLPDEKLDIATWGTPPDGSGPLWMSRSSVVGEFDSADPEKLASSIKNHIYLTFGAEALALMSAFDVDIQDLALLRALAEIMDNGHATPGTLAVKHIECETAVAMWAVLALDEIPKSRHIAVDAILSAFSQLPLHLRRHLGPTLAERFLAIGESETATSIRNMIARAPGDHGDGFDMLEAEIALERGDEASGVKQLGEIVTENGPLAPTAVISLIDSAISTGQALPPGISETASSMAFEAQGTEHGEELTRVSIRAVAHKPDVLNALEMLATTKKAGTLPSEIQTTLRREIYRMAASDRSDSVFLQAVFSGQLDLGETAEDDKVRSSLATRLAKLGLTDVARKVLAANSSVPGPSDRRLFAESFIAEQRTELAIGYLAGLTDPESALLRARAHEVAGDYALAAAGFEGLGDVQAQARSVWRNRDWEAVAAQGSAEESAIAKLAMKQPVPEEPLTPLARNRSLLDHSQKTRNALDALLKALEIP